MGAVVDVLRRQLLERTAAQPQVLNRPWQVARRRGERQQLSDDLELLAGLTIDVDGPRLDLTNDLAVRFGPQAIELTLTHEGGNIPADWVGSGRRSGQYSAQCVSWCSMATCCAGPAATSTTRVWPRRCGSSGTRFICSARTIRRPNCRSWMPWAAGRTDGCAWRPFASRCAAPSTCPTSAVCCPSTWRTPTRTSTQSRSSS